MTDIDPVLRYKFEAIQGHPQGLGAASADPLNAIAVQVAQQYRADGISSSMVSGILRIVEFLALCAVGLVIRKAYVGEGSWLAWEYPIVILSGSLIAVLSLNIADAYQFRALSRPLPYLTRILTAWVAALGILAIAGFLLKWSGDFSRVWFGSWFISGFVVLLVIRAIVARLVNRWVRNGVIERRAVIVGGGEPAEALIRSIEAQPFTDIRICGIFDDRDDERSPPLVAGYPKLGTVDELVEFARIAHIDLLIVCLPLAAETRVLTMLKKLWVLPVDIRLSANTHNLQFRPRSYSYIGRVPMLDIFDKPINGWDSVAKRIFDIVFSLLGIVLFSPIMLATAIAIKLDSKGPVIFKQKRHGFNNEEIEVLKFRSMYIDQCDPTARNAVTRNDPRVTRVGRFIRKTSIDELPQFFNSLFGTLSLVGPRPHAVSAQAHDQLYYEVVDGYFARHRVKPGVTGWAQISGWRGEIDTSDKIRMRTEFDLHYIENWSIWLDLKILLLTPIRLFHTENAY